MMGFDGDCCGCILWTDKIYANAGNGSPNVLTDSWIIESGTWTYTYGGLSPSATGSIATITCTSASGSLLCRYKSPDEVGYFAAECGSHGGIQIGDWTYQRSVMCPATYRSAYKATSESDPVFTTYYLADTTVNSIKNPSGTIVAGGVGDYYAIFNGPSFWADGSIVTDGLATAEGCPSNGEIRLFATEAGMTFTYVQLLRKESSGTACLKRLCNRATPVRIRIDHQLRYEGVWEDTVIYPRNDNQLACQWICGDYRHPQAMFSVDDDGSMHASVMNSSASGLTISFSSPANEDLDLLTLDEFEMTCDQNYGHSWYRLKLTALSSWNPPVQGTNPNYQPAEEKPPLAASPISTDRMTHAEHWTPICRACPRVRRETPFSISCLDLDGSISCARDRIGRHQRRLLDPGWRCERWPQSS